MKLEVNRFKYKNTYLLVLFYILLSLLHFKYIIDFQDFNYVSLYGDIEFYFMPSRYTLVTLMLALNIFFLLFFRCSDFMYAILVLILFFFVIPSGLVFSSSDRVYPLIFMLHNTFFYGVALFSLIGWNVNFPSLKMAQSCSLLFLSMLVGIIPFIVEYGPYINFSNLLLSDIYKTRTLVLDNVDNLYTAYSYSWFSKIIIPIVIVFCIYLKRYWRLTISILALLFLFLCGAHKTVFAGVFVLLLFYKHEYLKKIRLFLLAIVSLIIISMLSSLIFGFDLIWDYSFRRGLMLTALLDYCYFDLFKDAPIYWSNSFLSSFIDYPYELTPDHMVGKIYFNRPETNANVGIISDGYKNWGVWGSLINIVVVSIYLSILNALRISAKFFGLFVLLLFSFLNSALPIILLTHGGLVLLLISILMLRNTKTKMDDSPFVAKT